MPKSQSPGQPLPATGLAVDGLAGHVKTAGSKRQNVADIVQLVSAARRPVFSVLTVTGNGRRWPSALNGRFFKKSDMPAFLTVSARQLNDLTNQVQAYDGLLRDIRPELDALSAQKVEQIMREVSTHSHLKTAPVGGPQTECQRVNSFQALDCQHLHLRLGQYPIRSELLGVPP